MIIKFRALNGLCSSITESQHKDAVKKPYHRSSHFNALAQMLNTNQLMDKLGASAIDFKAHGMLNNSMWAGHIDPEPLQKSHPITSGDDDGDGIDEQDVLSEVKLAKESSTYSIY